MLGRACPWCVRIVPVFGLYLFTVHYNLFTNYEITVRRIFTKIKSFNKSDFGQKYTLICLLSGDSPPLHGDKSLPEMRLRCGEFY